MKSKVKLSTFSLIVTVFVIGLMVILAIITIHDKQGFYALIPLILILLICRLFFAPTKIIATEENIIIKAPINKLIISIEDIATVENFQPVLSPFRTARIRLFASGGFMGYWGVFYDPLIGKFTGYFGDTSSCFLLIKKNGEKYVLGCVNPEEMVRYIKCLLAKL